ncbi:hypothetical protein T439DRAFT_210136 [Meredithblackwellia eburnea MCA 4105]
MSLCCCLSSSDDFSDQYIPLPMSPGFLSTAVEPHELLLLARSGSGSGSGSVEAVNLSLGQEGLSVLGRRKGPTGRVASTLKISKSASSTVLTIPYIQILSATVKPKPGATGTTIVTISAVRSGSKGTSSKLWTLEGDVGDEQGAEKANAWVQELEKLAYPGSPTRRRLLVLVNPHGGQGKAKAVWEQFAEPVFRAANCKVKLQMTGPPGSPTNASALAHAVDISAFDAIVCVSGDGIVHEILNGLANREDAVAALKIPVVTVPAGSGNALNVNLHGPKRADDRIWAALSVVKGTVFGLDLCSVTQGEKHFYSFLSQAQGLMADLDLGTEHLRWMGDTRFVYGYIQGSLAGRRYPVELSLKVVQGDKSKMVTAYNEALSKPPPRPSTSNGEMPSEGASKVPVLKFGKVSDPLPPSTAHDDVPQRLEPGWHTFKTSIFFLYAGMMPYVAKDFKIFPPAYEDGLIDVAIIKPRSRLASLSAVDGAEVGKAFYNDDLKYFKCEAFRLTPLAPQGYISIDGESVPHETFQVECHPHLARTISMTGRVFGQNLKPV